MKFYLKKGLLQKKCMLRRVKEINNDEIPWNPSIMQDFVLVTEYKFVCIHMLWTSLVPRLMCMSLGTRLALDVLTQSASNLGSFLSGE